VDEIIQPTGKNRTPAKKRFVAFYTRLSVRLILRLIVPAVVLLFLIHKADIDQIKTILSKTDIRLFAFSFLILCLRNVIGGFRSQVLLRQKNHYFPLGMLTRIYFIAAFFNLFMPTVVGGDIARGYYFFRYSKGKMETVSSIIVERILGITSLMVLALFSGVLVIIVDLGILSKIVLRLFIVSGAGCVLISLMFFNKQWASVLQRYIPQRIQKKITLLIKILKDVVHYGTTPVVLFYGLLISSVFQIVGFIAIYTLAISVGSTTAFINFWILLPVIWVFSMLPISINGLGLREVSFIYLFSIVGMKEEIGMAICVLSFVQIALLGIMGSIFFLFEGSSLSNIFQFRKSTYTNPDTIKE
jgi:glycosyltransferase 2 family protein